MQVSPVNGLPEAAWGFEQTILPHLDAAYNLARWLLRDPTAAEDAVQDACLRALKYFGSFRGGDGRYGDAAGAGAGVSLCAMVVISHTNLWITRPLASFTSIRCENGLETSEIGTLQDCNLDAKTAPLLLGRRRCELA